MEASRIRLTIMCLPTEKPPVSSLEFYNKTSRRKSMKEHPTSLGVLSLVAKTTAEIEETVISKSPKSSLVIICSGILFKTFLRTHVEFSS
jgi:hypothetical protein